MVKLIITDKEREMFFERDGLFSSDRQDAKIFKSEKEAEQKSIELQLMGSPVYWIEIL